MDETVALALRNNRTLRADLEMIGQADAELLQASLMQNPMISFMVMFPDGGGRSMLRGTIPHLRQRSWVFFGARLM